MNTLAGFCLLVCVISVRSDDTVKESTEFNNSDTEIVTLETTLDSTAESLSAGVARSISNNFNNDYMSSMEQEAALRKHTKPLKNIFMGIYKNYKSTYLGNRTTDEYKQNLKDRNEMKRTVAQKIENKHVAEIENLTEATIKNSKVEEKKEVKEREDEEIVEESIAPSSFDTLEWMAEQLSESTANLLSKKRNKRKRKPQQESTLKNSKKRAKITAPGGGDDPLLSVQNNAYNYSVGPGVNMSLDMEHDVISVNLNGNNLREIITGHWLGDNSEEGRGKKYDMMTKVLPLFILPFLIQSAIVPFLVTKLKLLLMKSILVGKLAIFLLIISAIKNSNKMMQTYEVGPSYWAGEPSRRSELAAAASSAAYNGYRVEGKPTTWIN